MVVIIVDVVFPEINCIIDFQLDEDVPCWDLTEEIATMAGRSQGRQFDVAENAVLLYSVASRQMLNLDFSLKENGVKSGDRLLLI